MKNKTTCSVAAILLAVFFPFAARALDMGISYAVFATPDQTYVEVNLEIAAQTVTFKNIDSTHLQAGVEITMMLKQGDKVINFEKYILNSPLVAAPSTMLDVKRFVVPNGDYTLEVISKDLNTPVNTDFYTTPVRVSVDNNKVYLSEVQLLRGFKVDDSGSSFNKNGYFIEPLPFNFYDKNAVRLAFYAET